MKPITLNLNTLVKLGIVGAIVGGVAMYGTVEYTARSEFCSSCHIMEPYYESWQNSAHSHVACVDCHYEPGLLETGEGKFKALSQLAKYVTATQGTKPWAEVDDSSCLRSGCHSERLLEGTIAFGRIKFDHRHHLLETRRGRRLRCTSCHSQIVQGEHISVTETSCFLCHFRPTADRPAHDACDTCHGPPPEEIAIGQRAFRHADYVQRGVECRECHGNVTRGEGLARKNRCHSCHGDEDHIDRFEDTQFIHENHITLHKIECTECHDPIDHGLEDREHFQQGGDCARCHPARHQQQWSFLAGRGGQGVEGSPSAMFETRVQCLACHREGWSPLGRAEGVTTADEVSCLHCHGHRFEGMLAEWHAEVDATLPVLQRELALLEARAAHAAPDARATLAAARADLDLVRRDGSRGAHHIEFTLSLLRSVRDRIDAVGPALGDGFQALGIDVGLPIASEYGCASACHVGIARGTVPYGEIPFAHRPHLVQAEMDCGVCHSEGAYGRSGEPHGRTLIGAQDCTSCHHSENAAPDCATCHPRENALLTGTIAIEGVALDLQHTMADLPCIACHLTTDEGTLDPAPRAQVVRKSCVDCHGEGYADFPAEWKEMMDEELATMGARVAAVRKRVDAARAAGTLAPEVKARFEKALRCFDAARLGVPSHNVGGASSLLSAAADLLDQVEASW